uniref:Uncharacterized protein n=1 Tax=Panagrolaimus sp. PS1159 TaxID=55785 RepID=A0AC35FRI6_9BILA
MTLLFFLTISSCFAAINDCDVDKVRTGKCKKEDFGEYFLMITFPMDDYILPGIAVLMAVLPSLICLIIMIVFANKPLQRDPTEEDIEAIQEDEADLDAKNKKFLSNMKNKKNFSNQKAKNQKMKEFEIKNENVNQEDNQTVPIQPVQDGVVGASVVGQSAISGASKI